MPPVELFNLPFDITDLSFLRNAAIKNETDLERIARCVDYENYTWPESQYSETRTRGMCWILRSLNESIGVRPNLKFCDIGLGRGTIVALFALLGYKTYATDFDRQPLEHAAVFFERVQKEFGRFAHKPQLVQAEVNIDVKEEKPCNISFQDGTRINEMDLYYAFVKDDIDSTPKLMRIISPQTGSAVIHFCPWFDTPERLEMRDERYKYPTYKELGFRLANQNLQMMDEFERNRKGLMEHGYRPIWVKE